jgi:hypothetical protein
LAAPLGLSPTFGFWRLLKKAGAPSLSRPLKDAGASWLSRPLENAGARRFLRQ